MSDVNELNDDVDPEMWDDIDLEALKVLRSSPIVDAMLVDLKRKMQPAPAGSS